MRIRSPPRFRRWTARRRRPAPGPGEPPSSVKTAVGGGARKPPPGTTTPCSWLDGLLIGAAMLEHSRVPTCAWRADGAKVCLLGTTPWGQMSPRSRPTLSVDRPARLSWRGDVDGHASSMLERTAPVRRSRNQCESPIRVGNRRRSTLFVLAVLLSFVPTLAAGSASAQTAATADMAITVGDSPDSVFTY